MGMQLKQAGHHDFVILEKAATLGGTWRDNTYPGASCDAPSFLYSFSFAQKTDWSRRFAWQSELLGYSVDCASAHGLLPHMPLQGGGDARRRYDDARAAWRVELRRRQSIEAQFLVDAAWASCTVRRSRAPGSRAVSPACSSTPPGGTTRWTSPASASP